MGTTSLGALSSLDALFELDEMSAGQFGQSLNAGDVSDLVFIRPHPKLNYSSFVDEYVIEDTKMAMGVRSESATQIDSMDPFYP